jgi:hypothetical protein
MPDLGDPTPEHLAKHNPTYPWPACAVCSTREQKHVAVESYGIERARTKSQRSCKYDLIVWAECSHGADDPDAEGRHELGARLLTRMSVKEKQTARIEIPTWWSDGVEASTISRLIFFQPGQGAPETDEVQRIK